MEPSSKHGIVGSMCKEKEFHCNVNKICNLLIKIFIYQHSTRVYMLGNNLMIIIIFKNIFLPGIPYIQNKTWANETAHQANAPAAMLNDMSSVLGSCLLE